MSELGEISKHECYEAESEKAKALGELSRWRNQQLEALKDIAKKGLLKEREPVEAWRGLRDNLPLLSRIVKRVLSQLVAASACEQTWSILDFFQIQKAQQAWSEYDKCADVFQHKLQHTGTGKE